MKAFEIIAITVFCAIVTTYGDDDIDPCHTIPDGTFIGDPQSCEGYIRCSEGESNKGNCPDGLRFDAVNANCNLKDKVKCKDDVCTESNEGRFFKDDRQPRRCSAYLYCSDGVAVAGDCPDGLHFSKMTSACIYKQDSTCVDETDQSKIVCANVPNGVLVGDVDDCQKYYECERGVGKEELCPSPDLFNSKTGECDNRDNVECEVVCSEEDGYKRNPKSSRSYFKCEKSRPVLVLCTSYEVAVPGASNTYECKDQMSVSDVDFPNRCDGRIDGFVPAYTAEAPEKCRKYHPCRDEAIIQNIAYSCPGTKLFNDEEQKCMDPSNVNVDTCRNNVTP